MATERVIRGEEHRQHRRQLLRKSRHCGRARPPPSSAVGRILPAHPTCLPGLHLIASVGSVLLGMSVCTTSLPVRGAFEHVLRICILTDVQQCPECLKFHCGWLERAKITCDWKIRGVCAVGPKATICPFPNRGFWAAARHERGPRMWSKREAAFGISRKPYPLLWRTRMLLVSWCYPAETMSLLITLSADVWYCLHRYRELSPPRRRSGDDRNIPLIALYAITWSAVSSRC